MSNKSIGITLSVIAIVAILAIYFFINDFQKSTVAPSDVIPTESIAIIKLNRPERILKELSSDNIMWESLDGDNLFHQVLSSYKLIDSVLQLNAELHESFFKKPFYIAIIATENDVTETLIVKEISSQVNAAGIQSFLTEHYDSTACSVIQGHLILLKQSNEDSLYIKVHGGLLLASSKLDLLDKKNDKRAKNYAALEKFVKATDNKTDARLFINYAAIDKMALVFPNEKGTSLLELVSSFAKRTEADIKIKKDEILINGFSTIDSGTFLSRFKGQLPLANKVTNIIPFNTIFLFNQCFSDFQTFAANQVPEKYNSFIDQVGNEVALLNNSNSGDDMTGRTYALVQLAKGDESKKSFTQYAKVTGSRIFEKFGNFTLQKINDKEFLKSLFGQQFSDITHNWFTFIEDYAVFSNSKAGLENFIRLYDTGKTLDLNENFKIFSDNISTKSSVLIYCQPDAIIPFAKYFVNSSIAKKLKQKSEKINDLQGIALQFSAGNDLFYTSFYLKHNKSKKEENLALWKVQLDDIAVGKPTLVWDHNSKNYNVLVFDKMSNMYLINAHGQIQWKKRIDGQLEGEIFEVDYFKNGKIQYLFNTKDFIYLIDKNGDFVESYPIKISPFATNGISLFDYKKNKDYRLMLAQADKKVYNYDIKGKTISGWGKPKTKDIVKEEITRIVSGNKDYFIITDIANNISIVNRRGNERVKLKEKFNKAIHSAYYENKTNSKGFIITTDEKGKLVYINASGSLQYTDFGKFSPQHFFLYKDFKGDGVNEFIYLDGRSLKVFDRFKKVLFSYDFSNDIAQEPVIFDLGRNRKALGVVSADEKTIYLFDQNGNTIINKGIVGETPFTVGSLNNDNELNLITASGEVLYNYRIK